MWIDNRTNDIKVYEKASSDPFVKKMTWRPEENAWVVNDPVQTTATAKER